MKALSLCAVVLLMLVFGSEALAVKTETQMTPKNLEAVGFALNMKDRDDGTVLVTIVRDTTKAHWPKRDGALEIYEQERGKPKIIWCRLEAKRPRGKDKHLISYEFIVSPKRLADTWFTVGEVQTANGEEDGELVLGGGDYYRFKIADFIEKKAKTEPGAQTGE